MSQRYQKEIEEILDHVNEKGSPGRRAGEGGGSGDRPMPPGRSGGNGGTLLSRLSRSLTPGRMLLGGVVLLLAAFLLRSALPEVAGPLTWTGVGLFVAAYVTFFLRPRGRERRWRGRSMEDQVPTRNPWIRFWRWLNRG